MAPPVFGFIGLGDMGGPMARRLFERGLDLVVFDASEAATRPLAETGATVAVSLADLAERCDVVMACLPTPAICLRVASDIAASSGGRVQVYTEMSTVGIETICAIEAALDARGIVLLDSPISGGPKAVVAGTLACLVSGPRAAVDLARPAYDALAHRLFHLSEQPGAAQAMKLGNNLLAAANLAMTSEVVRMLEKAGIAPSIAIDVINVSTGRNRASESIFPTQIVGGEFNQGARLRILAKDTQLALNEADRLGSDLRIGAAVRDVWISAEQGGLESEDITRIYDWIGRTCG